jgi:hypothetical protein
VVAEQGGGYYRRYVPSFRYGRDGGLMIVVAHGDILRWIADGQSQGHMSSRVRLCNIVVSGWS